MCLRRVITFLSCWREKMTRWLLALSLCALQVLPAAGQTASLRDMYTIESQNGVLDATLRVGQYFFENTDLGVKYWTRVYNPENATNRSILQPGPVLRFRRGDTVHVTLVNDLGPETTTLGTNSINSYHYANKTNVHTHGLHVTAEDPQDNVLKSVAPGENHYYTYTIPDDHAGGTFWYHAHHHGATSIQVGGGLLGAIVIEDEPSDLPYEIYNLPEVLLLVSHVPFKQMENIGLSTVTGDDLTTHSDNDIPGGGPGTGEYAFVNGQYQPSTSIESGQWQRVRMIYSSLDSTIQFSMTENSANCMWFLLAKDGIYVDEAPRTIGSTVYMGPGNRVDVVLKCLNTGTMTLGSTQGDNRDFVQSEIVTFNVVASTAANPDGDLPKFHPYRPDYLADVYTAPASDVVTQSVNFQGGGGTCTINGLAWDGTTAVGTMETGSIQEWSVQGNGGHPFHLHVNSYQLKTVSGITDGFYEEGDWHDVVLTPGALSIGQYVFSVDSFVTKSVLHCHFLTHEDLGCMGYFQHTDTVSGVTTGLVGNSMTCTGTSTGADTFPTDCPNGSSGTTEQPSMEPTSASTTTVVTTHSPSDQPSMEPSAATTTVVTTHSPSDQPSMEPSAATTTVVTTHSPSDQPSMEPTSASTTTVVTTHSPSDQPSMEPSAATTSVTATNTPSQHPSNDSGFTYPDDDDICNHTRLEISLSWVHNNRGSSGLVRSYISDESWTLNRGYTYGNALAAISLLLHSDSAASPHLLVAEGILDALSNALVQDSTDSSAKYSLFYCDIESGSCDGLIRSGQNAWVAEAFALHWLITGSNRYEAEVVAICNYLLLKIAASGDKGCITGGPDVSWCSVEHAIDSYFVLHSAGFLANNTSFEAGASIIASSLFGDHIWNSAQKRFNQGYDDTYFAMDVNSWGSVFLLNHGEMLPSGVDTADRVAGALSHLDALYLSDQICVLNNDIATGYGPYADSSNNYHSEAVWSEGTLGVALAYRRNRDLTRVNSVVSGLDPMWSSDGSLLYAAAETVVDVSGETFYPFPSIAGSGWYGLACGKKSWVFWNADVGMYNAVFGTYLQPSSTTQPTSHIPSIQPSLQPSTVPSADTTVMSMSPTVPISVSMSPTAGNVASVPPTIGELTGFIPQVVEFGNLTSINVRTNKHAWASSHSASVCPNTSVLKYFVLSMKSIIQSPNAFVMNMVVHLVHRKRVIKRPNTFLKLSIVDMYGQQVFAKEQNLFEESDMLTHFSPAVNVTSDTVNENLKVGLQVNFLDEFITPWDMSYSAMVEVGIRNNAETVTKVYDCVTVSDVGVNCCISGT